MTHTVSYSTSTSPIVLLWLVLAEPVVAIVVDAVAVFETTFCILVYTFAALFIRVDLRSSVGRLAMQAVPSLRGLADILPELESTARVLAAGSPVKRTQFGVEGSGILPTLTTNFFKATGRLVLLFLRIAFCLHLPFVFTDSPPSLS